jgi:CHAT domain-containing protein
VLAVGVAEGDGRQPTLPEVRREIAGLTNVVPPERLTVQTGAQATRHAVMRALTEHSWLHLAGHTQPDPERPLHTGIVLSDGPLSVLDLAGQHLEGAQLAYLSTCLTTLGSGRLLDEALHLSAVLQLVGYRHVVATQWHIEDQHAARIAEAVYSRLARNGELDADNAARALHDALDELHERAHPVVWAAYVHQGP